MFACLFQKVSLDVVNKLLKAGAEINATDRVSKQFHFFSIVILLLIKCLFQVFIS